MLARVVHVIPKQDKNSFAVKPKEYFFRVDKPLSLELKKGMVVASQDQQLVYVKEVISDPVFFLRKKTTNSLVSVVSKNPTILAKKKPQLRPLAEKAVYKGVLVVLKEKKFERTNRPFKFKSTQKIWGKIRVGDIVPLIVSEESEEERECFVLVQEILLDLPKKQRPLIRKRRTKAFFYKKTDRGYRRTRYIPVGKSSEELKKKDQKFEQEVQKFVVRKRK